MNSSKLYRGIGVALMGLLVVGVTSFALAQTEDTVCHWDNGQKVYTPAPYTNGHAGHANDVYPVPEGGCGSLTPPPPTDVCSNIDGIQETIPDGYEALLEGQCTLIPTDTDGDGIPDDSDNCPQVSNADQMDTNQDGVGDACTQNDPGDPTGSIEITKYVCPEGTTVVRSENGVNGTVPVSCALQEGASFGYVHGDATDTEGPYPELGGPFIEDGSTDGSGVLTWNNLAATGRYLVVETDGAGNKLPNEDVLGLYCEGDGDTSDNNDNQELTFVPENGTAHCVAYNEGEVPSGDMVTIHTQKIVCDEESDLPNWGAGTSTLNGVTSNTANRWLNANAGNGCALAEWQFQWVDNAASSTNPGDETEIAPAPWSTPFIGSVTFDASNMNRIWLREVFDTDYIPFTGANTTENESAEMYCGPDILNYDNWEFIDKPQGGWASDYYCVAWNVPTEKSEGCYLDLYSDTQDWVVEAGAYAVPTWVHGNWTSILGATWIWKTEEAENPRDGDTYTFKKMFNWTGGTVLAGDLEIATDNSYEIKLNGSPVASDATIDNFSSSDSHNLSGSVQNGLNTLEVTVENWPWDTDDSHTNPGGLLYHFALEGDAQYCGEIVDEEPEDDMCELTIVSDTTNVVVENGDTPALEIIPVGPWSASIPGATWIWDQKSAEGNGIGGPIRTFKKEFEWDGPITSAILDIAADNSYKVWINEERIPQEFSYVNNDWQTNFCDFVGDLVGQQCEEYNYNNQYQDQYDVADYIDEGTNVLKVEVYNWHAYAGALYKLVITGENESCEPDPEPEPICDPEVNLLANGGFEAPDVNGGGYGIFYTGEPLLEWITNEFGIEIQDNVAGAPFAGNQHAELDPNHPTAIWQSIETVPGWAYRVETQYSPRPGRQLEDNRFEFTVNGSALGPSIARAGGGATDWSLESRTFVAGSNSVDVGFREIGTDTSYGAYLDDAALYCIPQNDCLIEGYKYDSEGTPLEGWTIGLNMVSYEEEGEVRTPLATDETDENGYYCVTSEEQPGDSTFEAFEELQKGWSFDSVTVDGSDQEGEEIDGNVHTPLIGYPDNGWIPQVDFYNERDGGGNGDDECLIEGHKFDENGNPLSGWTIGLFEFVQELAAQNTLQTVQEGTGPFPTSAAGQVLDTDITDGDGYYCLSADDVGQFGYGVFEELQDGWSSDHMTEGDVDHSDDAEEEVNRYTSEQFDIFTYVELDDEDPLHIDFYNKQDGGGDDDDDDDDDDDGGGSSSRRRSSSSSSSSNNEGEVLGEQTSILPLGAPATGRGGLRMCIE